MQASKPHARCSRDLALRLGAVAPETTTHHRLLVAAPTDDVLALADDTAALPRRDYDDVDETGLDVDAEGDGSAGARDVLPPTWRRGERDPTHPAPEFPTRPLPIGLGPTFHPRRIFSEILPP